MVRDLMRKVSWIREEAKEGMEWGLSVRVCGCEGRGGEGGGAPALEIDQIILCVCVMYGGKCGWEGEGVNGSKQEMRE